MRGLIIVMEFIGDETETTFEPVSLSFLKVSSNSLKFISHRL